MATNTKTQKKEERVYTLVSTFTDLEFMDDDDAGALRELIRTAIEEKSVDGILDFVWQHDIVDLARFDDGDCDYPFEVAMAALRVHLDYQILGRCRLFTPAIHTHLEKANEQTDALLNKVKDKALKRVHEERQQIAAVATKLTQKIEEANAKAKKKAKTTVGAE